jgi:hypothetical protein
VIPTSSKGLSDHCLTLSGWGITIAALGLAVLGPYWSSFVLWVGGGVRRVCGLIFVYPFDYDY